MRKSTVAAALPLLALTACGHHAATRGSLYFPDCTVWHDGNVLQVDYGGCERPDGSVVDAVPTHCKDGRWLQAYSNAYAFEGEHIHFVLGSLTQDSGYEAALAACRG